ncbi:ras/Rap GTPase-activating protein SynGAP [Selaginella moellendorffii]|uniref:ras/Rap GTPase-activating protein SynGAP n=1 Tax=Selaginella moellendorffii TaxID=88036 RepID=UPI000D1CA5C4|nr:ras/Rap GTPase-activating protein SynGAP [Selaginella moellendorffii]|eukprot:XP_024533923.1 ras/Rap GTPase-activating protein SynGAP [Selaginella moellendorffii]
MSVEVIDSSSQQQQSSSKMVEGSTKQVAMSPKHHALLLEGGRTREELIGIHSRHASESLLLKGTSPVALESNGYGWSTPKPDAALLKVMKLQASGGGGKKNGGRTAAQPGSQENRITTDEESADYDSSLENTSSVSSFDFNSRGDPQQRSGGGGATTTARSMLKPAPSKWDDAEKWLVSSDGAAIKSRMMAAPKMQQLLSSIPNHVIINASKKAALLGQPPRGTAGAAGGMMPPPDDKKIDGPAAYKFSFMPSPGGGGGGPVKTRSMSSLDRYPLEELHELACDDAKLKLVTNLAQDAIDDAVDDDLSKPALRTEKPTSDFSDHPGAKGEHQSPGGNGGGGGGVANPATSYVAPPGLRSVSMRDMGTEMTPIASQEPSRTGTPIRATTPTIRSPVSSRPSTPGRITATIDDDGGGGGGGEGGGGVAAAGISSGSQTPGMSEHLVLSEKHKTRQEIRALGAQLGKANIAAWASREEEEEDASKCLKNIDLEEVKRNVLETRAAAWEEAEKAKYEARYKREESKIVAWENHEKAKAEAEMRRIEVKVERMRSHSHEQLMNKLAIARRRAEDLRAAAESRRVEQAAKTAQRADYIRQTGNMPEATSSPLSAFLRIGRWCC